MQPEFQETRQEVERLRQENAQFRQMLGMAVAEPMTATRPTETTLFPIPTAAPLPAATAQSSLPEQIALFRRLFQGREDVYAVFWRNERTGKHGYAPVRANPWSAKRGQPKQYLPLTDDVMRQHLEGRLIVGLFPLLKDSTCYVLACDFDGESWALDALALLTVCTQYGVPAYLERSRSGQGGHVWFFFAEPVTATSARQLGMRLLRDTMTLRGEMDLASYDRFFPNQDFVPKGGFGNLIALPLQHACRAMGYTEFLNPADPDLRPWSDQWALLSQARRLANAQLDALLEVIPPITVGFGTTNHASEAMRRRYPAPHAIRCTVGAMLSVEKSGLPPWLLSQLKHLAALHNPQFYERQRLRLSTFRIPRFIKCYDEDLSHLHLPRGVIGELNALCETVGSRLALTDARPLPPPLALPFHGQLTTTQTQAMRELLAHDMGVLVAPPGAGKTVMGCYAIAQRNVPTLILAHRKPILEQWRAHLMETLGLSSAQIGQVGGGRHRQHHLVDMAMIQSLARIEDLEALFSHYGFLLVDECHHLPAATFEACVKRAPARYILGLTATPYRRDGLQEIITMQCGPIRSTMHEREADLVETLVVRDTSFDYPTAETPAIHDIFRALVSDATRNALILDDVCHALAQGRRCLLLSQWREHCRLLAEGCMARGLTPFLLDGTLGKKERTAIVEAIQQASSRELLVIATGQYLGEGFDCPQMDTLLLAFPIAFKGKLVQYVGRILRSCAGKDRVTVYDYADIHVPMLGNMHRKRLKTYKSLGFTEQPIVAMPGSCGRPTEHSLVSIPASPSPMNAA